MTNSYFSEYDAVALSKIIETQKQIIEYQKKENYKTYGK